MRLIDADAIIEEYCGDCAYRGTELCDENEPSCGTVGWIKDAPTVDAVEVVRCKDCIHDGLTTCPLCYIEKQGLIFINHDPEFFCAFGGVVE